MGNWCIIICFSFMSFFSTSPTREHIKCSKGGSWNGPHILLNCTSFCNLSLINSGLISAEGKLSRTLNERWPSYSSEKPCKSPLSI